MSPIQYPWYKRFGQLGLVVLLLALAVPVPPVQAVPDAAATEVAVAQAEAAVTLLESGPGSLTLEFRAPELTVEESSAAGGACHMLTAPGLTPLARAGRPLVPVRGELLGLPVEAELQLEVLEAVGQPLPAHKLCLAEMLEGAPPLSGPGEGMVFQESAGPDLHPGQDPYPGPLAEVGFRGMLRGQPVAQVLFNPVQVEDGGERLLFYPRLRVRLTFDPAPAAARPARLSGGPYEALLDDLLLNDPLPVAPEIPSPPPAPARAPSVFGALKVYVEQDGMVQITPGDLASAGWDVTFLDPQTLKVSNQGTEVRAWVPGQDDGSFDTSLGDYLLFYGQAMTGRYTRRNVYWLTAGGGDGLRMQTRDGNPVHGWPVADSFAETLHAEVDIGLSGYWQNPPGGEGQDHWYWTAKLVAPASADLPFNMPPFETSAGDLALRVKLAGVTDDYATNPDHHTRIRIKGTQVDDATWNGMIEYQHGTTFSPDLLAVGANTLRVETLGGTGASVDTIRANWLEIDYQGRYESQNDELAFGAPGEGNHRFEISGFGSGGVEAFDITVPAEPVRLRNVQSQAAQGQALGSSAQGQAPGSAQSRAPGSAQTAVFEDHAGPAARYVALAPAAYRDAAGIEADAPSDLRNPANGADLIIISHDGFYDDVQPLVVYRQGQGLRVQAARLTDVQDEFSGGVFTPAAIRDFLAYAYGNWQTPAPAYVLLVGDANMDYLDRFGTGMPNYIPTYVIDASEVGETGNDNWFACVDGDDYLPDLFLGRFSAQSSADVQAMVSKAMAYEGNLASADWDRRAVYVADDDSASFEEAAENWIGQLPAGYQEQRIYVSEYSSGDPNSDIVSAINAGAFAVSYVGHGNQDRWGTWSGGQIFNMSTVSQLTNVDRLPFMATATCLNGFFVNPYVPYSIAEELARKADGGAIGVWSPSALGYPSEHDVLFGKMFDWLFGDGTSATASGTMRAELAAAGQGTPTMGMVTTRAKVSSAGQGVSRELIETFTLFGDPAVDFGQREGTPTGIDLASFTATFQEDHVHVAWDTASEFDLAGFNLWRSDADDSGYDQINEVLIPVQGNPLSMTSYSFDDAGIVAGKTYYYKLEAVQYRDRRTFYGPVRITISESYNVYLPLLRR